MESKKGLKILLEEKESNSKNEILDCTKEIEEYMKKVIPREDEVEKID